GRRLGLLAANRSATGQGAADAAAAVQRVDSARRAAQGVPRVSPGDGKTHARAARQDDAGQSASLHASNAAERARLLRSTAVGAYQGPGPADRRVREAA